jgi:hypothetical protein
MIKLLNPSKGIKYNSILFFSIIIFFKKKIRYSNEEVYCSPDEENMTIFICYYKVDFNEEKMNNYEYL